jgi:hypothetical protein
VVIYVLASAVRAVCIQSRSEVEAPISLPHEVPLWNCSSHDLQTNPWSTYETKTDQMVSCAYNRQVIYAGSDSTTRRIQALESLSEKQHTCVLFERPRSQDTVEGGCRAWAHDVQTPCASAGPAAKVKAQAATQRASNSESNAMTLCSVRITRTLLLLMRARHAH